MICTIGCLLITREDPACWIGSYGRSVYRDKSLWRLLWRMARGYLRDLLMLPQVWRERSAHAARRRRIDALEAKLRSLGFDNVEENQRSENRWIHDMQREWVRAPEDLVGALQDRIHCDSGAQRAAKSVKVPSLR